MTAFLSLFLHVLVSPFKTQARLEAEIVLLRHQLNVLRRRVPSKPKITMADRLLFVWVHRLFPSLLNAITIVQPMVMPSPGALRRWESAITQRRHVHPGRTGMQRD